MNLGISASDIRSLIADINIGIESESLRLTESGNLSETPHPFAPEDPNYTRDFAESQLEIITDAYTGTMLPLEKLTMMSQRAIEAVSPEVLWPFSMPPELPEDEHIRIADFGDSQEGRRMKLYRRGLAARYGRKRQMICGVHVNISMGDRLTDSLSAGSHDKRRRIGELYLQAATFLYHQLDTLILLTGASPDAGPAFPGSDSDKSPVLSVRNGDQGYGGDHYRPYLDLSSVNAYVEGLERGLRNEPREYRNLGLVNEGRPIQLSRSAFQLEKEFYAPIRLRRAVREGESQIIALRNSGPGYLELRFFDRNPSFPGGIGQDTLNLVHLLFVSGLLENNKPSNGSDLNQSLLNAGSAANMRIDSLLSRDSEEVLRLLQKSEAVLEGLRPLAELIDTEVSAGTYTRTLEDLLYQLSHPGTLPGPALNRQYRDSGLDWTAFGLSYAGRTSKEHSRELSYAGV